MNGPKVKDVTLEGVRLVFRNFSGTPDRFNKTGKKLFSVVLPQDVADELSAQGWNVKRRDPRDEDDDPLLFLGVEARFNNYPPEIWMVVGRKRILLDDVSVSTLDHARILDADVVLAPYPYQLEEGGEWGIKAYLRKMYVTIEEDELDAKYSDLEIDR